MIIKRKTQIILALIISSVFLFQGCASISRGTSERRFPERKKGAVLLITKTNGQQIRGELITVKPNSLLLLNAEGRDVSVEIEEIKIIRIVKKSKMLIGAGLGASILIVAGGLLGGAGDILGGDAPPVGDSNFEFGLMMAACFSPVAALLGGTIGAIKGIDKTIYFVGMTDSEIEGALDKLRKKARIRDYK